MNTGAGRNALPRAPRRRVDGIVLLDKPGGLSSNQALQQARQLLSAAKAGHAGTLDPMATGMLPLCFGQATKACGLVLGGRKAYRARLSLGVATDTGDAMGKVVREAQVPALDVDSVGAVLAALEGVVLQVPPMVSALKHGGERLYELARRGETVERAARRIELHRLRLLGIGPGEIEFEVECSKGTYVRVLGEDIANGLGTLGHLTALRRLWVAPFESAAMLRLEDLAALARRGRSPGRGPRTGSCRSTGHWLACRGWTWIPWTAMPSGTAGPLLSAWISRKGRRSAVMTPAGRCWGCCVSGPGNGSRWPG